MSASWSLPKVKQQRERELFLLEDAKRRVEGLPPVLGSEKARVPVGRAKAAAAGQRTIDSLFAGSSSGGGKGKSVIAGGALEDSAQQRKRDADRY